MFLFFLERLSNYFLILTTQIVLDDLCGITKIF